MGYNIITFPLMLLWNIVKFPFMVLSLIMRLKWRHAFIVLYLISVVMFASMDAIKQKNPGVMVVEFARVIVGADSVISKTISDLAKPGNPLNIWDFFYLIYRTIGSFYVLYYILYLVQMFFIKFVNVDTTWTQTIIIVLPIIFLSKVLFFTFEAQMYQHNVDLTDSEIWVNSIPFKFIYDFIKNIKPIAEKLNPPLEEIRNYTKPYVYG